MTPNNNLSILPFYTSIERQNHRKDYAFGEVFPLVTPNRKVLPFQIQRPYLQNGYSGLVVWLCNVEDSTEVDISAEMVATGLKVLSYSQYGYEIIKYKGVFQLPFETKEGQYYLKISDGVHTFYSEVYTIVRFVDEYLRIIYYDSEDLVFDEGRIDYSEAFKFCLYLPTQVGRPDYEFEEVVENRDGYKFIEKQTSEKTYKFTFTAPEYLLDAMRVIRMADNIEIRSKGETYYPDEFLITPVWQDGGYLAAVEAEFQCSTVIKKIGRGKIPTNLGDFNIDYNDDFNIT